MAGKRTATYELNHDNFDEELPPEEAGQWKPASEDVLKNRPKLKARRTVANIPAEKPSLFSGFSFGVNRTAAPPPPPHSTSPFANLNFGTKKDAGSGASSSSPSASLNITLKNGNGTMSDSISTEVKLSNPGSESLGAVKIRDSALLTSVSHENDKTANETRRRLEELGIQKTFLMQERERIDKELLALEIEESGLRSTFTATTSGVK